MKSVRRSVLRRVAVMFLCIVLITIVLCRTAVSVSGASSPLYGEDKWPVAKASNGIIRPLYTTPEALEQDKPVVDLTGAEYGYICVFLSAQREARVCVRLDSDNKHQKYDTIHHIIADGRPQVIPLCDRNGTYTVLVYERIEGQEPEGNLYECVLSTTFDVKIIDRLAAYEIPNIYSEFDDDSLCVQVAAELADNCATRAEFVDAVCEYVDRHMYYDTMFSYEVEPTYIPNPDNVLNKGKGICCDFASLVSAMLRSQGVPTRMVVGDFVSSGNSELHEWNEVYFPERGWVRVDVCIGYNTLAKYGRVYLKDYYY